MLTKVEVSTTQGYTLVLPLEYSGNGYVVQEIEGLDPVKATIVSSSFANQDGEQYQSSRREARNIIIKLGLEKGVAGSVRDLRARLYSTFMPKATVLMRFFSDDEEPVDIYGKVESCFAPLFVQDPVATISLLCHQPDFYVSAPVVINSTTVNTPSEIQVDYKGSIETGIKLTLLLTRDLNSFTVHHRSSDNTLSILEFKDPLILGDMLEINTASGNKGAILVRNGVIRSVLYGVSPMSTWINFFPGTNYIRVHADGTALPVIIEYTTKLGGL